MYYRVIADYRVMSSGRDKKMYVLKMSQMSFTSSTEAQRGFISYRSFPDSIV